MTAIRPRTTDAVDDITLASTYVSDAIRDLMYADQILRDHEMTPGRREILACIELTRKTHASLSADLKQAINAMLEEREKEGSEC